MWEKNKPYVFPACRKMRLKKNFGVRTLRVDKWTMRMTLQSSIEISVISRGVNDIVKADVLIVSVLQTLHYCGVRGVGSCVCVLADASFLLDYC